MKTITLTNGKEIELNQAFNIDCLEFMKMLPDKCIDLVLTDPPYGIGESKNKYFGKKRSKKSITECGDYDNKDWDIKEPDKDIFNEIFRVSKNQIIWGVNNFTYAMVGGRIYWHKNVPENYLKSQGELAYQSYNKMTYFYKYTWHGMIQENMKNKETRIHPTQKPLNLFRWCLNKYAKEGDIVFDPFLGSFTTAISSDNCNMNWLGCELDPDYFKSGYHRYEQETKQMLMEF